MSRERVVGDRYELVRPIGRGATGVVYVARHRATGQLLAVKLIPARAGLTEHDARRFLMEASAPAQIGHPGIVAILDAGYDAHGSALFVAMELLHGETLRDLFERDATTERKLDVLEALLSPLSVAHAKRFVHRDLKPENVFAARRRTGAQIVKLLDFGLAPQLEAASLAAPGASLGSPPYMAPEQLEPSASVGPAADVWAFGVMLYEALAGGPPFEEPRLTEQVCRHPHAPLDALDVDPAMARLADLCLEKDPRERPPDARALMRLMKSLRAGAGALVRSGGPERDMTDTVLDAAGSAPEPPPAELDDALRRNPHDPAVHRALLAFYRDAGVIDGVWLAASALELLGEATREEIELHHHYRRPPALSADRGLDPGGWAALLHHDQDPRVDSVWSEIADALAGLHRQDDDALALGSARKLDLGRPGDELARTFALAVGALRTGALPRLYRGPAGATPRHLPAAPPASIFPRGFEEPLPAGALHFAVGRHVAYYRGAHRVCTLLHEPDALESVFDAALRLGIGWRGGAEGSRMAELLAAHMPEAQRASLTAVCARLGTSVGRVDLGTWRRAVELSCARAGVLLSGDLGGAAWMLRWSRERRRIPADDAIDDLLAFWTSGAHVRLRHQLGLAIRR